MDSLAYTREQDVLRHIANAADERLHKRCHCTLRSDVRVSGELY